MPRWIHMRERRFTPQEDREAEHIIEAEHKREPQYSKKRLNKIAYGHVAKGSTEAKAKMAALRAKRKEVPKKGKSK